MTSDIFCAQDERPPAQQRTAGEQEAAASPAAPKAPAAFSGMAVYGLSKLYNVWFMRHLAELLASTPVTVNAVTPGEWLS